MISTSPAIYPVSSTVRPGEWTRQDVLMLCVILAVATTLRFVFFQHAPVFFEGDARGYLVRAVEISTGEGFQFSLKRTPGYPMLMAAVFSVVGPSLEAVVIVQHALGIATALLIYACARQIAGRTAGLLAGLATALSGSMLIYEHVILTEALFTFLLVASLWLVLLGASHRSWRKLGLAGGVASLTAMIRPVGLCLALVVPLVLLWLAPRRDGLKWGAAFLVAFGLVMAPWVLRNALVHGEAEVVHPGRFLIDRTIRHNATGVSMYSAPDRPGDSRRIRTGRAILRAIEPEEPSSFEGHAALMRRMQLTDAQASDLLRDLAIDAILRSPAVYLQGTLMELTVLVNGTPESVAKHVVDRRSSWKGSDLVSLIATGTIPELIPPTWDPEPHLAIAEAAANVYQPARWNVVLLILAACAAFWGVRDSSRRAVLLPLGIVAAMSVCTVLINGALPRYRYPMDPLLHVAAASSLVWIGSTLRVRLWRPGHLGQRKMTHQPP